MNRRNFLSILGTVAATAALDPERLLWVPGAKMISVPADRKIALLETDDWWNAGMTIFPVYDKNGRLCAPAAYYLGHYINGIRNQVECVHVDSVPIEKLLIHPLLLPTRPMSSLTW